jgi:hypothetical protein
LFSGREWYGVESVEAFTTAVIASYSDVASVLFASAMGM